MTDIVGYEGKYKIDKSGNVWSYPNRQTGYEWRHKYTFISSRGYECVTLYKGKKSCSYPIHVLVGKAYLSNPERKRFLNHKDGNKLNNQVDNLEWATAKENAAHAVKHNLMPQSTKRQKQARTQNGHKTCKQNAKTLRKITFAKAEEIRNIKENQDISYREIARMYNLSDRTVASICQRKIYNEP